MSANLPAVPSQYHPAVLGAQMDYARALAQSSLLPRQYQGNPANLLWAISYGQTLGVDPMTAVQSIHVINGKPTASADLIAGLVRRAGHKLRVSGDDKRAVVEIVRSDDPDFAFRVEWTIERAQAAKLTSKDTWKQFPAAMLKARAITECARAACSEILQGTIYTPEELGAVVDQDGNPVDAPVQPLRAVQVQPEPTAEPRDFLHEAYQAATADEVRRIWQEAKAFGSYPAYLEQIAEVGRKKGVAAAPEPAESVVDAELVDDAQDEHVAAVAELRAVAEQAGIAEQLDEEFYSSYGLPIAEAHIDNVREMTRLLRGAA
jgi:hypothetical protein